ncbi:MAG: ABC transporter substrate-binding protein [Paracoccus sp. (in: a-proteobacteria)]|nr:ABC transporter substrate-binding protein [Paracoccus sp. (in: a-proteobacteria)]
MVGRALAILALLAMPAGAADIPQSQPPARVVSINLCTDQLALMLAAPGQLISVSYLAHDPKASVMAGTARAIPVNHGLAEDILRLAPDLVLAGRFSATATVQMLERTGQPVAMFDPETSMDDIRANILRMGALLGREDHAAAILADFDADLAALEALPRLHARAAVYGPNGYSPGHATLAGSIVAAAGLENLATELGLPHGGMVSLEHLVQAQPDLVILSAPERGASRAEEVLTHPALARIRQASRTALVTDADWTCGTPKVLRAAARLRAALETAQ